MTLGRSFKKIPQKESFLNLDPDLSDSDLSDEDEPIAAQPKQPRAAQPQPARANGKAPAVPRSVPKTHGARSKARGTDAVDMDAAVSSFQMSEDGPDNDQVHEILQQLFTAASKRKDRDDAKIEQEASAARQVAFEDAEAKIQEAKAKADKEYSAAVAAAEKKLGASKRRLEEATSAFEADCSQLLSDIKAAVKKAKAASAESEREHTSAKEAMERVLKTHKAESDKIIDDLELKQRDILTRELNLGGIIKEISLVASALEKA